jgi:hypothetical protein
MRNRTWEGMENCLIIPRVESLCNEKGVCRVSCLVITVSYLIQEAIEEAKAGKAESKSVLGSVISQANKALDSLTFARFMPELLTIISSLITNLQYREGDRRET